MNEGFAVDQLSASGLCCDVLVYRLGAKQVWLFRTQGAQIWAA